MSKFFVGQRVRIVGARTQFKSEYARLIGKEGVVNELDCFGIDLSSGNVGVTIDADPRWCFLPRELEPILPEGSAPSEFTFRQLMDNLQEIYVGVGIPAPEVVEAAGFLSTARIGGEM